MSEKVRVFSSRGDIEEATKDVFWRDVIRELKAWKKGFEMERMGMIDDAASNNPSTAAYLLHEGDLNGRVKAIDYVLNLPSVFIGILEEQEDDSRRKRTD